MILVLLGLVFITSLELLKMFNDRRDLIDRSF